MSISIGGKIFSAADVPYSDILIQAFIDRIHVLPDILAGLVILLVFYIAGKASASMMKRLYFKTTGDASLSLALGKIIRVAFTLVGIVTALGTAGVNITGLAAGLGLSGVAIGMTLKDAFSNSLYGFMIMIYKPFIPGDIIIIHDSRGIVEKIDLRYTTLQCEDGVKLVPNAKIFSEIVTIPHKE